MTKKLVEVSFRQTKDKNTKIQTILNFFNLNVSLIKSNERRAAYEMDGSRHFQFLQVNKKFETRKTRTYQI